MAKRTVWIVKGEWYDIDNLGLSGSWIEGVGNSKDAALEIVQRCIKNCIEEDPIYCIFKTVPTIKEIEDAVDPIDDDLKYFYGYEERYLSIWEFPVHYKRSKRRSANG